MMENEQVTGVNPQTANKTHLLALAIKKYRKIFVKILPILLSYLIIVLAFGALGVVLPWTFILSVPLVILPFTFALQVVVSSCSQNENAIPRTAGEFFRVYLQYFSRQFNGVYRILKSVLIALLIYILTANLFGLLTGVTMYYSYPDFKTAMDSLLVAIQANDTEAALQLFNTNYPIQVFAYTVQVVNGGIIFMFLMWYYSVNSLHVNIRFAFQSVSVQGTYQIKNFTKRQVGKEYTKTFYKNYWPFLVITFVGYIVGSLAGFFIFPTHLDVASSCGIFGGLLFIIFYLPIHFLVLVLFTDYYLPSFNKSVKDMAAITLQQLKNYQQLNEEESKRLEEVLKKQKEELDNLEKENPTPEQAKPEEKKRDEKPNLNDYGSRDGDDKRN